MAIPPEQIKNKRLHGFTNGRSSNLAELSALSSILQRIPCQNGSWCLFPKAEICVFLVQLFLNILTVYADKWAGQLSQEPSLKSSRNSLSSPTLHSARFSGSFSSPLTHSFGNFILWNKIMSKYVKQFLGSLFSLRPATWTNLVCIQGIFNFWGEIKCQLGLRFYSVLATYSRR